MPKVAFVLLVSLAILNCAVSASAAPVVTINFPANGSTVNGPVYYAASASSAGCAKGIAAIRIYSAPAVNAYTINATQFSTFLDLKPGTYNTTAQAWDFCNGVGKATVKVTVAASAGVSIYAPLSGANSPVHFVAAASSPACAKGIAAMRIYPSPFVNAYTVDSNRLDTYLSLPDGAYNTFIQAWDKCGHVFKTLVTVIAQNTPSRFVYQSSKDLNFISAYRFDAGLSAPTTFNVPGGNVNDLVVDRAGKFAFAAVAGGISAFLIDSSSGALTEVAGSPFSPGGAIPIHLAIDPSGNTLYATASNLNAVLSFRIYRDTGRIKLLQSVTTGLGPAGVITDPSGKFIYIANSTDNTITAFKVDPVTGAFAVVAGSPFATGLNPQQFSTSNRFLYALNRGNPNVFPTGQSITGFFINPDTGALTAVPGSPVTGQPSASHYVAVDAVHDRLYQPSTGGLGQHLDVYSIDPTTGALTFQGITAEFQEERAETLLPDYSGKSLWMIDAANGSENSPAAVQSFAIDASTGNLSPSDSGLATTSQDYFGALAVAP